MGTDIHCLWQKRNNDGTYTDVPSTYEENRHYYLFAWLGNVRNGYGFAGIKTHEPLKPLSNCRGIPSDIVMTEDFHHPTTLECITGWRLKYRNPDEPVEIWLGYHSHSWLDWDEIINGEQPIDNIKTGIISIDTFNSWDKKSPPKEYCGGISGPDVVVAENINSITPQTTDVRVQWVDNSELQYFIDIVKEMKAKHGNGRLVFGFDS